MDIQAFKTGAGTDSLDLRVQKAKSMFKKYLEDERTFPLHKDLQGIVLMLNEMPSAKNFESVQEWITTFLAKNSYSKFCKHNLYRQYLQKTQSEATKSTDFVDVELF